MEINKWDNRFLELAKLISTWSKDSSTKVGAVITNDKNRIISLGFNGYPRMVNDENLDSREEKYAKTIHAELNSILFSRGNLCGCTLYVYPLVPCSNCMASIIQVQIQRVVVLVEDDCERIKRWQNSNEIALKMAEQAHIDVMAYFKCKTDI